MPRVGFAAAPIASFQAEIPRGLVAQWLMILFAEILNALSNGEKVGRDPLLM